MTENTERPAFIDWPEDKPGDKEKRILQVLRDAQGGGTVFIPRSWIDRPGSFWKTAIEECDWLQPEPPLE